MKSLPYIKIELNDVKKGLHIIIDANRNDTLFDAGDSAVENNEARYQLVEGCFYDYVISDEGYLIEDVGYNIIQPHKRNWNLGTIAPNIYVGTLEITLIEKATSIKRTTFKLEVQSLKSGYRDDYRDMLEFITEKCTDLLLHASSPVYHYFEVDHSKNSHTLYQKFAFIKSVIGTEEFSDAIHRIVTAPVTRWTEITESKDIRNSKRILNAGIKEILKAGKRTFLPENHFLMKYGINSLKERITTAQKIDSVDTHENRFIKHVLQVFLKFCTDINNKAKEFGHSSLKNESDLLARKLDNYLHHSVFKHISRPSTLKLNSPVLQRKEGYREILRVWLMFDLAARLVWEGGDEVYSGGKKDIATLYEYWLFFTLLDLLKSIFNIEPRDIKDLIKETPDGLNLLIKQGRFIALKGIYNDGSRKLNIRFCYNRSFGGKNKYPYSGSWTTTLRPDYTLTIWPFGITEAEAELQELIVHIHFDAKYKIDNLAGIIPDNFTNNEEGYCEFLKFEVAGFEWDYISDLLINNGFVKYGENGKLKLISMFWENIDELGELKGDTFIELSEGLQQLILSKEKTDLRKGKVKNADLLKMHTYRDAIRRTCGAYVLYPGNKSIQKRGFHEIIPGLGAFSVRPYKMDSGIGELKAFIIEVVEHIMNRSTQREKFAYSKYDIHKYPPEPKNIIKYPLPEAFNENRDLIPDTTFVLVGFYNSSRHFEWIRRNHIYNFRMGSGLGSLALDKETVGAKFLLLHTTGDKNSGELWKIISKGPRVYSKMDMVKIHYPKSVDKLKEFYLVVDLEPVKDPEFANIKWNFRRLKNFLPGNLSAIPFTTTLSELMKNEVLEAF